MALAARANRLTGTSFQLRANGNAQPRSLASQTRTSRFPGSLRRAITRTLGSAVSGDAQTFRRIHGGFATHQSVQGLRATFRQNGVRLRSPDAAKPWSINAQPQAFGRTRLKQLGQVQPQTNGPRIDYPFHGMTEWYRTLSNGLEQGFTVRQRPSGIGTVPLSIEIAVRSSLQMTSVAGGEINFSRGGWSVAHYGGLKVVDAQGRKVPARLAVRGRTIRIMVDDRKAQYPLRVDPYVLTNDLTASDGKAGDYFGYAVALSSDASVALVGAPFRTINKARGAGAAYVFTRGPSGYTQAAEVVPTDGSAGDGFGFSVALSADGTVALIGAESHTVKKASQAGAVYVFTGSGSTYTQEAELKASGGASGDAFGYSVALAADGSTAFIGAPGRQDGGAAYVFSHVGSTYKQSQQLTDPGAVTGDGFGSSVAVSTDGSTLLAGSPYSTVNGSQTGAAFVFSRTGSAYTQIAELSPTDGMDSDGFGSAVALSADGSTALVTAPFHSASSGPAQGAAYVFLLSAGSYAQTAELTAADGAEVDNFGSSAALSADGTIALIGSPLHAINNVSGEGAAYVFSQENGSYVQTVELTPPTGAEGDGTGSSVAVSADGKAAMVGAPYHLASRNRGGTVYDFVNLAPTTTSVSRVSGPRRPKYGNLLTFRATVSPASGPSGSVTLWDGVPGVRGSVNLGSSTLVGGTATIATRLVNAGNRQVYAAYSGDSVFAGSQGFVNQTVSPVALTIAADSQVAAYGGKMPAFTFSASGFVNGDTAASFTTQPTCLPSASEDKSGRDLSPAGSYPITCSGAIDTNYVISYRAGTLSVSPGSLTITASSPRTVYGRAIPQIKAIYEGLASSDKAPTTPPVCTSTAKAHDGVGTYPTACSGASDSNYVITYQEGLLRITPARLKIQANSFSVTYGHHLHRLTWRAKFVNGDTPSALTKKPKCTSKVQIDTNRIVLGPSGRYRISCSGAVDPNYAIRYAAGRLTVALAKVGIKYTGARTVHVGSEATFSAHLFTDAGKPVVGRSIVFRLGTGAAEQRCTTAASDAKGNASCTIPGIQQATGSTPIRMRFAGDPAGPTHDFAPASTSFAVTVKN